MFDHDDVIDLSIFVCYIKDKFGAIQTPKILDVSEEGIHSIFCAIA